MRLTEDTLSVALEMADTLLECLDTQIMQLGDKQKCDIALVVAAMTHKLGQMAREENKRYDPALFAARVGAAYTALAVLIESIDNEIVH